MRVCEGEGRSKRECVCACICVCERVCFQKESQHFVEPTDRCPPIPACVYTHALFMCMQVSFHTHAGLFSYVCQSLFVRGCLVHARVHNPCSHTEFYKKNSRSCSARQPSVSTAARSLLPSLYTLEYYFCSLYLYPPSTRWFGDTHSLSHTYTSTHIVLLALFLSRTHTHPLSASIPLQHAGSEAHTLSLTHTHSLTHV